MLYKSCLELCMKSNSSVTSEKVVSLSHSELILSHLPKIFQTRLVNPVFSIEYFSENKSLLQTQKSFFFLPVNIDFVPLVHKLTLARCGTLENYLEPK